MQPFHKLHFTDGEMFTTFHERPEQSFGTVEDHALATLKRLTPEQLEYAFEYRAFHALHDIMDGNTILPFSDDAQFLDYWGSNNDALVDFWNAVIEEIDRLITPPCAS